MRYFILLIFTFSAALTARAQTDVTIKVINSLDSLPVAYATCYMVSVLHEGKVSAVTSADGNCEFKNIPAGDYRLEVINIGQTKTCRIKVTGHAPAIFQDRNAV